MINKRVKVIEENIYGKVIGETSSQWIIKPEVETMASVFMGNKLYFNKTKVEVADD